MMQLLNLNNSKDYFKRKMNITNDKWTEQPRNQGRYYLFKNKEQKKLILFKYTRDSYHKADGGVSESINVENLKEVLGEKADGYSALICICYEDGEIWTTKPENFVLFGYKKEGDKGEDDNDRYILNWKATDENNQGIWKVLKI